MSKRKTTRSFETEKRMEIRQTGYARMTVTNDEYLELPLESGILNMGYPDFLVEMNARKQNRSMQNLVEGE